MARMSHQDLYRKLIELFRNYGGWSFERRHRAVEWFFRIHRIPLPENRFVLDPTYCPGCPEPRVSREFGDAE